VTVVFLLSLTGIPPTAGFVGKLFIFAAAIESKQWAWLAFVGVVNSVISLYYYMNIAKAMYFGHQESPAPGVRSQVTGDRDGGRQWRRVAVMAVVLVTALGTLALCVVPGWLIEAARLATMMR